MNGFKTGTGGPRRGPGYIISEENLSGHLPGMFAGPCGHIGETSYFDHLGRPTWSNMVISPRNTLGGLWAELSR